jgi:hypothetical protein
MIDDYAMTIGWKKGLRAKLFDIGVPAVAKAFEDGIAPLSQFEITITNWNNPKWIEQPVSSYSVSGGTQEDFAEAVMVYITNPGLLMSRSPKRYKFIHSRKSKWILNMRQTTPNSLPPGDYPLRTLPPGQEYV